LQDPPLAHLVPAAGCSSPATRSCTAGGEAACTRDTAFAAAKAADGTDQFLKDPLLTTVSKEKKTLRTGEKKNLLYPHVGRKKRTSFHPHVFSKVMPQALVLLLVPCLPPSVHRVTKTSGRKLAGRRDDRGGHTRRRPVATPRNIRIALRTAAGRTAAGGVAASICRQARPTAPTTRSSDAGYTNTGGGTTTIRHQPRPTTSITTSSAAGYTKTGGGAATIRHQPRHTAPTMASSAAGCTNTGGGTATIRHQPRPTTPTTASSAAGCTNTGGGSTTIRSETLPTTATLTNPVAGRTTGRITGRGRGLNSPVPHALGSATNCVSASAAAGRQLGSGGHSSA